jgi:hypothetical protein
VIVQRVVVVLALLMPTTVYSATAVFLVSLSGYVTGATDHAALIDAFDAAYPGDTVQLTEGALHLQKCIGVPKFSGNFTGEGRTPTTIESLTYPQVNMEWSVKQAFPPVNHYRENEQCIGH